MFAVVALLAFVGGALHPPNNYDAVTYHMPRLLQWLAAGHWTWISTANQRMNYSAANFEWLTAPLLVHTRTDRLVFLLNFLPFLFLPSLVFSTYRMLGVQGRVAWTWMWVLPTGYCYALQAGSVADDAIGAVFVLASLHFGLLARRSQQASDVWLAILTMALATGVKASNLPLVLPSAVVLWPVRRLLLTKWSISALIVVLALLVSYLPTAALNEHFTGSWTGDPRNASKVRVDNPLAAFIGNALQLSSQTVQPPFLPGARTIEARLTGLLPRGLTDLLQRDFWNFELDLRELPREEATGLGLGVAFLLATCLLAGRFVQTAEQNSAAQQMRIQTSVMVAAWTAFLIFMVTMGSEATARLLSPYYPILLPSFLAHPANARLVRERFWRAATAVVVASAVVPLVLTPSRPLWPAATALARLQNRWPKSQQLMRASQVYSLYRQRNDVLGPLRDCLPADVMSLGLIAAENDSDLALWRPFGSHRRITYLTGTKSWEDDTRGLAWIVGKTSQLSERYRLSMEQLLMRSGSELIAKTVIVSTLKKGAEEWFVLRLPKNLGEVSRRYALGAACEARGFDPDEGARSDVASLIPSLKGN
jgi:hypothetical protein